MLSRELEVRCLIAGLIEDLAEYSLYTYFIQDNSYEIKCITEEMVSKVNEELGEMPVQLIEEIITKFSLDIELVMIQDIIAKADEDEKQDWIDTIDHIKWQRSLIQ